MTRYSELQELTKKYGNKTTELIKDSQRFRDLILSDLPNHLGCDRSKVTGVPPNKNFKPGTEYNDECLSIYHQGGTTFLEPVEMGVCIMIDNIDGGGGGAWAKIVLSIWIRDDMFEVHVGKFEKRLTLPRNLTTGITEVLEAIYTNIEATFSLELDDTSSRRKIGFILSDGTSPH